MPFIRRLLPFIEKSAPTSSAEQKALQQLMEESPEVLGTGTSKAKFIDNLPIEDADVTSPLLTNASLPLNKTQKTLERNKAILATLAAGGGGALALNLAATPEEMLGETPTVKTAETTEESKNLVAQDDKTEEEKAIEEQIRELSVAPKESAFEKPGLKDIDFGAGQSTASLERLKEALQRSRDATLVSQMGQAGAAMAAQMSGTRNLFEPTFQEQLKKAAAIPDEYLKEVQFEKEDPNSPMSQGYRNLARSMGFNIQGTASAADLERLMPQLANIYNQEQAQESRAQMAKENRESRLAELQMRLAAAVDMKKSAKDDKQDRFVQSLRKEATAGSLGKMFNNYNTALRMGNALEQFAKDPGAYKDYATLMGGLKALQGDDSVVREAEVRLGMSATSLGNKIQNWTDRMISGKSLQPEQRAEMVQAVKILSETARKQYADAVQPILKQAQESGIDPNLIFSEGTFKESKAIKKMSQKLDPKVDQFAKQHQLDYNQALKILKARGYNVQE